MFHEITDLATKYSKSQLAQMAQTGLIDPTKAVMAGMMIDRISKQNMQPPTTTVAQDILQQQPQMGMQQPPQGQPQEQPQAPQSQGLPGIPAPNMEKMAGGGIVAFDEGGHVPGYAGGPEDGSVVEDPNATTSILGDFGRSVNNWFSGGKSAEQIRQEDLTRQALQRELADTIPSLTEQLTKSQREERRMKAATLQSKLQQLGRPPVKAPTAPTAPTAPAASAQDHFRTVNTPAGPEGEDVRIMQGQISEVDTELAKEKDPAKIEALKKERNILVNELQNAKTRPAGYYKNTTKATPTGLAALPTGQEQAAVQPSKGIGAIMGEIEATPQVSNIKQQYAGLQKDIEASNKASDEFAAKRPEYVPSEKYEKSLQKEEAGTEAKQKENFKMALINAGLAIAGGKSQFALQNIAEGAQVGTKQYMEGMKDLEKAAKEREKALAGIEEARNLYADKKYDRAQAMFDKNQDRLLGAKQTALTAATSITGKEIDTAGTMVNSQNTSNAYIQASQGNLDNKEDVLRQKYIQEYDKNILLRKDYPTLDSYLRARGVAPTGGSAILPGFKILR